LFHAVAKALSCW